MASVKKLDLERAKKVAQTVIGDVGTVVHGALVFIGDRMGLFKAMMDAGPLTVEQLAAKTELSARYIREWLGAMAAAHYVDYDVNADTYLLTPEYAAALADEDSPFFIGSYFQMAQAAVSVAPKVAEAFKSGKGVTQAEYPVSFFEAAQRNSRTRYLHKLMRKWIPAMPQVVEVLSAGGIGADVGCGGGLAAIMLAQAYPKRGWSVTTCTRNRSNARGGTRKPRVSETGCLLRSPMVRNCRNTNLISLRPLMLFTTRSIQSD